MQELFLSLTFAFVAASAACAARFHDTAAGWLVTAACEDDLCSGWPGAALFAQVGLEWAEKAVRRGPCMEINIAGTNDNYLHN
jgi:hypothetical protein